jgi:hypothetical protein
MTEIVINNIPSLCAFIRKYNPSIKQVNEILWHLGIKAIITNEAEPEIYCSLIKDYWQKWKHTKERAIFIDLDVSLID